MLWKWSPEWFPREITCWCIMSHILLLPDSNKHISIKTIFSHFPLNTFNVCSEMVDGQLNNNNTLDTSMFWMLHIVNSKISSTISFTKFNSYKLCQISFSCNSGGDIYDETNSKLYSCSQFAIDFAVYLNFITMSSRTLVKSCDLDEILPNSIMWFCHLHEAMQFNCENANICWIRALAVLELVNWEVT